MGMSLIIIFINSPLLGNQEKSQYLTGIVRCCTPRNSYLRRKVVRNELCNQYISRWQTVEICFTNA